MIAIPTSIVKRVPYVGPVVSGVGLALDVKAIVETATPVGAAKIIAGRLVNECTPPRIADRGKMCDASRWYCCISRYRW